MYHLNKTKNKILKAALEMINKSGFGSLTISELARQSKISKQSLYYHYTTMEDVLITLAEQWSQTGQECTLEALAESHKVGIYKILDISTGMFDWMRKYPELSRLGLVLFQTGPFVKKLSAFMERSQTTGQKRIRDYLEQEDIFRKLSRAELDRIVVSFHSLMYGFFLYVVALNDFRNIRFHEANCSEALQRLIHSYLKE